MIISQSGGTGTVRGAVRAGTHRIAESSTPVPVLSSLLGHVELARRLAQPHLEMTAWPGAVPCARHHARQLLWDVGLKELIEPVEQVVSEIATNAVLAAGGMVKSDQAARPAPVIRLWVSVEADAVLVLVWDASPSKPERQELAPGAESGRGLFLVELFSSAWGWFELIDEPGKVVWALCQS